MIGLGVGECQISRIVVPFAVDPTESTPFTKGSRRTRLRTYYRSSVATFGTIRRFNPDLECVFATNEIPPQWVARQFERLNVRIEHVGSTSTQLLPAGTTFRTSLFLFDVLRATAVPNGEVVAYLDPDVLCVRSIEFVLEDGQVGCLPLETRPYDSIKGITLTQIADIRASLGRPKDSIPTHVGGEILAVTPAAMPAVLKRIEEALSYLATGYSPKFLNEEHVLTYASDRNWCSMRSLVARIWTDPRYHDIPEDVLSLALWHLPAEKTRGLQRVYQAVRRRSLDRLSDYGVRRLLGRCAGVIPTPRRAISDHVRRTALRVFSRA
jgi:hypothetical protein